MKFCVVALPRSRTAWLAAWLGASHEPLSHLSTLDEAPEGVVDTASALFFPGLFRRWPDARYLFVFRDLDAITASCERLGFPTAGLPMLRAAQEIAYEAVQGRDNVLAVAFDHLSDIDTLRALWAFLGRGDFDAERAQAMARQNIQAEPSVLFADIDMGRAQALLTESGMNMQGVG